MSQFHETSEPLLGGLFKAVEDFSSLPYTLYLLPQNPQGVTYNFFIKYVHLEKLFSHLK